MAYWYQFALKVDQDGHHICNELAKAHYQIYRSTIWYQHLVRPFIIPPHGDLSPPFFCVVRKLLGLKSSIQIFSDGSPEHAYDIIMPFVPLHGDSSQAVSSHEDNLTKHRYWLVNINGRGEYDWHGDPPATVKQKFLQHHKVGPRHLLCRERAGLKRLFGRAEPPTEFRKPARAFSRSRGIWTCPACSGLCARRSDGGLGSGDDISRQRVLQVGKRPQRYWCADLLDPLFRLRPGE